MFSIRTRDPGSYARTGTLEARPRRGAHARVRAAGDQGRRQDARGPRGRRPRLRHGPREHVPPVPLARPRADRAARRPAPLPALGPADHHRLRRLPGLLDGPRDGRRRDQGPRRAVHGRALGRDPRDRGGGRALPLLPRRLDEVHGPGDLDGGPGRARLGHRAGLRRVHAVPRRPRVHGALDRAHAPLAGPLPGLARRARARGPDRLRHRPGRDGRGPAPLLRPGGRRPRRRSAGSRSAARSARTRRRCSRSSSGRSRSCRRPSRATCSGSARSTTSCAASSSASTPSTARCRPASAATAWRSCPTREALARRPGQGALARGRRAAARGLPVPGLRRGLLARLPALPVPRQGADRDAPAHDPQPRLPAAPDGRAARRDRRGPPAPRSPPRCAPAPRRGSSRPRRRERSRRGRVQGLRGRRLERRAPGPTTR